MKKKNDEVILKNKSTSPKNGGTIQLLNGCSKEELLNVLRLFYTSRLMDHKVMNLLKQGKSYFHLPSAGHEATQLAFGLGLSIL